MPSEHLKDDRDVEQILKLAVNKAGYSDEEALRQRMMATAAELGISDAEVQAAENEYRTHKAEAADRAAYESEVRKEFWEHMWSYIIVNAGLVGFNLFQKGSIGWAMWPLLGWGIGIAFHAMAVFATRTESYQTGYQEWKKKQSRRRKRQIKKAVELEEEAASLRQS